jgi:hypothetical protein
VAALSLAAAILSIAHVGSFVCFFYPGIPAILGGGKPITVRLLLKEIPATLPASHPAPTDDVLRPEKAGGRMTAPWLLLAETERSLILLGKSPGDVVEVSRDGIAGIRIQHNE